MEPNPAALEADLTSWGLIERTAGGATLTRRMRAALMRAAASLQSEEAMGRAPDGHPLRVALARAGQDLAHTDGIPLEASHVLFLFAVEMVSLPEAVRQALRTDQGEGGKEKTNQTGDESS